MKPLGLILILSGLGAVFGYLGWALYSTRDIASWTGGSPTLAGVIIGGVVLTGALTGVLMWLAFYSDRKGFDEALRYDQEPPTPTTGAPPSPPPPPLETPHRG